MLAIRPSPPSGMIVLWPPETVKAIKVHRRDVGIFRMEHDSERLGRMRPLLWDHLRYVTLRAHLYSFCRANPSWRVKTIECLPNSPR